MKYTKVFASALLLTLTSCGFVNTKSYNGTQTQNPKMTAWDSLGISPENANILANMGYSDPELFKKWYAIINQVCRARARGNECNIDSNYLEYILSFIKEGVTPERYQEISDLLLSKKIVYLAKDFSSAPAQIISDNLTFDYQYIDIITSMSHYMTEHNSSAQVAYEAFEKNIGRPVAQQDKEEAVLEKHLSMSEEEQDIAFWGKAAMNQCHGSTNGLDQYPSVDNVVGKCFVVSTNYLSPFLNSQGLTAFKHSAYWNSNDANSNYYQAVPVQIIGMRSMPSDAQLLLKNLGQVKAGNKTFPKFKVIKIVK